MMLSNSYAFFKNNILRVSTIVLIPGELVSFGFHHLLKQHGKYMLFIFKRSLASSLNQQLSMYLSSSTAFLEKNE